MLLSIIIHLGAGGGMVSIILKANNAIKQTSFKGIDWYWWFVLIEDLLLALSQLCDWNGNY